MQPDALPAAAEQVLVVFPLGVFTAWVTVATFANTAAALKESGWADVGLSEPAWAVLICPARPIMVMTTRLRVGD